MFTLMFNLRFALNFTLRFALPKHPTLYFFELYAYPRSGYQMKTCSKPLVTSIR